MYSITKSIDIDFAHHVSGHTGACINIHGHTWKFEVTIRSRHLNKMGFVCDFGELKKRVLQPVHLLLDHSLALPDEFIHRNEHIIEELGKELLATRATRRESEIDKLGHLDRADYLGYPIAAHPLCGAIPYVLGGIKLVGFPFPPTSERLAEWLAKVASEGMAEAFADSNYSLGTARVYPGFKATVYETLHPVEASATAYFNWFYEPCK
jgi:6-pyruvoyl tetrahydropterin synthase/QueD family protein